MSVIGTLQMSPTAHANHNQYSPSAAYQAISESANGLQYTSLDLKECFSQEFRRSGYYGKLTSRAARIKSVAKRLHRRAEAHAGCNWKKEIRQLDDLVCELDTLVEKAVYHSRKSCTPIYPSTVRKVRSLITKASYHVKELDDSLRYLNDTSSYSRPTVIIEEPPRIIEEPLRYNEPAPGYAPGYRASYHDVRRPFTRNHFG